MKTLCLVMTLIAAPMQIVVELESDKPQTVTETDICRIKASDIAGSRFKIDIEGPAKLHAERRISQRKDGKPLIGITAREFDLEATGHGKVEVTITIRPPTAGESKKLKFEYTVK